MSSEGGADILTTRCCPCCTIGRDRTHLRGQMILRLSSARPQYQLHGSLRAFERHLNRTGDSSNHTTMYPSSMATLLADSRT
jgi:hypothetical protein